MADQLMIDILEVCLHLDSRAAMIYRDQAAETQQEPLKEFRLARTR